MGTMNATELKKQERTRSTSRPRALVLWPWAMIIAAWTLALLAVLTNQTYLINQCQPKTETPTHSTNGFPGRICSRLDGFRSCRVSGRHPDSPAGG